MTMSKEKYKEIVINKCWGGFGLNHKGIMAYAKLTGLKLYPFVKVREMGKYVSYKNEKSKYNPYDLIFYSKKPLKDDGTYEEESWFSDSDIARDDINLVAVVKKMGKKCFKSYAELKIVKIPANVEYEIDNYDGMESIHEKHKSWG